MYKIVRKEILNPTVTLMDIEAPLIAKKAEPGQFIILRVDENGERIPLTVAGYDREKGTVTIIFQIVGGTTELLNHKNEGEYIHDFVGPLGTPTETEGLKKVCHHRRRCRLRNRAAHRQEAACTGLRSAFHHRLPLTRIWSFSRMNSRLPATRCT